jgi:multidrug efflux pump subunit AcrA (membrane-fusion protein)
MNLSIGRRKDHNYKNMSVAPQTKWLPRQQPSARKRRYKWIGPGLALILLAIGVAELTGRFFTSHAAAPSVAAPPVFTVSAALMENLDIRQQFLGQFSSVESVELRAQVGGTLTQIAFKDGDIVHKGDILFKSIQPPTRSNSIRRRRNWRVLKRVWNSRRVN